MLSYPPLLIYTLPSNQSGEIESKIAAKLLIGSLLRNYTLADFRVGRPVSALANPLFKVARKDVLEVPTNPELKDCPPWAVEIEGKSYEWVMFLGPGSLAMRNLEHLLSGNADILWAPLCGVPITSGRCSAYLSPNERASTYRASFPQSRPWREGASARIWAIRGRYFEAVMARWKEIACLPTVETPPTSFARNESAWNRLLVDTELRVSRFEKDEVQFPCLPGADFLRWKDAAVINVGDWVVDAQVRFLQAWYYGSYFGDPSGMFLEMVEP